MIYVPLTTTPIGWLILGFGGYALYKKGRKKGEEEAAASQITAVPAQIEAEEETVTKAKTNKGDK
jgi:uncharacterized membrane protein